MRAFSPGASLCARMWVHHSCAQVVHAALEVAQRLRLLCTCVIGPHHVWKIGNSREISCDLPLDIERRNSARQVQ